MEQILRAYAREALGASSFPFSELSGSIGISALQDQKWFADANSLALPDIQLGFGVDPFSGKLSTTVNSLVGPKIKEFTWGALPGAKVHVFADLSYEAFISHEVRNLFAKADYKPKDADFSGNLDAKIDTEARRWRAERKLGIRIAYSSTAGVEVAKAGDFGVTYDPELHDIGKAQEVLQRHGEFFISQIHRAVGLVVSLTIENVEHEKYDIMKEKYAGSGSYAGFQASAGSDLSSSIAQAAASGHLQLAVEIFGMPDPAKLSALMGGLGFAHLAGKPGHIALGGAIEEQLKSAAWSANALENISAFVQAAIEVIQTPSAGAADAAGATHVSPAQITHLVVQRYKSLP